MQFYNNSRLILYEIILITNTLNIIIKIQKSYFTKDIEEVEFNTKAPLTISDLFNKYIHNLPSSYTQNYS